MADSTLPSYLVDALLRFEGECVARGREEANGEMQTLRNQIAEVLGLGAASSLPPSPPSVKPVSIVATVKADPGQPSFAYGTIGNAIRDIMKESPRNGLLIGDIVSQANRIKELPITPRMAREALKRMKKNELVECRDRRRWMATEKLRGEKATNEIGAHDGDTASAPSAREVAASLIENQRGGAGWLNLA